jgi:biotin carboxyl carrier protein
LAVIEALKMVNSLTAPCAVRIAGIAVASGSQVAEGARMMMIETTDQRALSETE